MRRNLLEALKKLHGPPGQKKARTLWIDAICINQADISERSQQVRFMPHIYARAQTVLVWLGSPSPSLKARTEQEFYQVRGGRLSIKRHKCFRNDRYNNFEDIEEQFLLYLCRLDYWNRLWIIQEVLKAEKIEVHFCGGEASWADFTAAVKKHPQLRDSVPMKLTEQKDGRYDKACKLENLLEVHQNALCKDPRDRIFMALSDWLQTAMESFRWIIASHLSKFGMM